MDHVPARQKDNWKTLLHAANQHVTHGVVAANNEQRIRYWRHWRNHLWANLHPCLQNVDREEQIAILQVFAERVRCGNFRRGLQVRAGTVQDALAAIGKTCELDGYPNPLYQAGTNYYHIRLARQLEAYRRNDPPTQQKLAIPLSIPKWIFLNSRTSNNPHMRAIGELCLIAFFFLLRVGEYTTNKNNDIADNPHRTRTQQFRLGDIKFYANHQAITLDQLKANPNKADLVRLRIANQKNGRRGQTLSHTATTKPTCPVKACVARVLTLLEEGATNNCPLCTYRQTPQEPFSYTTSNDITTAVRNAIEPTKAHLQGYKKKFIGAHSLRAGGAMALFHQGYDATAIRKMGCWQSDTFLTYLHEQVDIISRGAAEKMSTNVTFVNLGA